jgi:hypothetical protein
MMERGELPPSGHLNEKRSPDLTPEKASQNSEESPVPRVDSPEEGIAPRPDNAPDAITGDPSEEESVTWEEGNHLVIETHIPGEDVSRHSFLIVSF